MFPDQKSLKGKFVIIDVQTQQVFWDLDGLAQYFDTEDDAKLTCGVYELENCWVVQLKYYHTERHESDHESPLVG